MSGILFADAKKGSELLLRHVEVGPDGVQKRMFDMSPANDDSMQ